MIPLCCVRQPVGIAPCWPWPLWLGTALCLCPQVVFLCSCPSLCCCQNLGIFQKEQRAWSLSRLTVTVLLAGAVSNSAARLLSPLQISGSSVGVPVAGISKGHVPARSIPVVPSPGEQGCCPMVPITQGLCFVLFARSLCENSACSRIKANKNQEDFLHAGHDRSLLQ